MEFTLMTRHVAKFINDLADRIMCCRASTEGDFPFPVYNDYDLAMEIAPVAIVIDCIGDLQDREYLSSR